MKKAMIVVFLIVMFQWVFGAGPVLADSPAGAGGSVLMMLAQAEDPVADEEYVPEELEEMVDPVIEEEYEPEPEPVPEPEYEYEEEEEGEEKDE